MDQTVEVDLQYSLRGWKIAGIGLFLTFNYVIMSPIFGLLNLGGTSVGWDLFYLMVFSSNCIGFPVALFGVFLSMQDKWRVNKKNIWKEIIVIFALFGNFFFWISVGSVGPT